jgi:two-component system, LuxR family, response regulator FixJ
MWNKGTVFVVDDSKLMRDYVCDLAGSMQIRAHAFASSEEFLEQFQPGTMGCLVTDVRMLGISGLDLLDRLKEVDAALPTIVMTAYARTPITVRAMRAGAINVLDKPVDENALWAAIQEALQLSFDRQEKASRQRMLRGRFACLKAEERTILDLIVDGAANKQIAAHLQLGLRTVEARRRSILEKLQAKSLAELIQMTLDVQETNR